MNNRRHVIFVGGGSLEKWSPRWVLDGGVGGSETALVSVSAMLAAHGHRVDVYSHCTRERFADVEWYPFADWGAHLACDALVISRLPELLDRQIAAPRRILWLHDPDYGDAIDDRRIGRATNIVAISEWHRITLTTRHPSAMSRLQVIPNGIPLHDPVTGARRFLDGDRPFAERAARCVYSSSYDRGLDVLLEMWPRIRERVPAADLHVFYGWESFDAATRRNPPQIAFKRRMEALFDRLGGPRSGVFMRGRLGQPALHEEMQAARVWTYPTDFTEACGIGAMEARAAGLAVVTTRIGGLTELVEGHGVLLDPEQDPAHTRGERYQAAFVDRVARLLSEERNWTEASRAARSGVESLDWPLRGAEWLRLLTAPGTS